MAWLDDRWYQVALDALKATLDINSELKAAMVQFLFDEGFYNPEKLTWEGAIARFNACLNPGKGEKFSFTEIWALSKRFEVHTLFLTVMDDIGYECRRKPTDERRQELQERLSSQLAQLLALAQGTQAELSRMDTRKDNIASIHPAIRERRMAFSMAEPGSSPADYTNKGF